jgi:hypothetical protein
MNRQRKRIGWILLILAISLPTLVRCIRPGQAATSAFDALARWVPGDTESVFFLDLKPDGEAGRHWGRFRQQVEANPVSQQVLNEILAPFKVESYGLQEFIAGPAVTWYGNQIEYLIIQIGIGGKETVRDALLQYFWNSTPSSSPEEWEQEEYEGRMLYHGRNRHSYQQRVAWTIDNEFLFLSHSYNEEPLTHLKALISMTEEDSLIAAPHWRKLRDRLPLDPMGLIVLNVAEQRIPPAPDDESLGATLSRQADAFAFAAVPEEAGMRVQIAGAFALPDDTLDKIHTLFSLPAIDPATGSNLPPDAGITLIARNASVLWPFLHEIFFPPGSSGTPGLPEQIRDTVGLDLEADLAGAEGPLTGDFALAITPPLPSQPVIQGLPAGQLLIAAHGASEEQMAQIQATMEDRGAVFGPGEIEGVTLQTQAGTELAGYAISYGFDGETLLFGSSPDVIGQAVAARREDKGLVRTPTFQAFLETVPDSPALIFYYNTGPLTRLAQTNMTEKAYQGSICHILEVFEAVGLSLQFAPDGWVDGVVYFYVSE